MAQEYWGAGARDGVFEDRLMLPRVFGVSRNFQWGSERGDERCSRWGVGRGDGWGVLVFSLECPLVFSLVFPLEFSLVFPRIFPEIT